MINKEKRLNAMKLEILKAEKNNLRTQERTYGGMVELINRIIKDEARKQY